MRTDYHDISKTDVLFKFGPLINQGQFFIRDDGKLDRKTKLSHDTPWIHTRQAPNRNCGLYHVYHELFGFVHSRCQECWKVVVRPRTLVELHKLLLMQQTVEYPCKCGAERRDTVCGLYGGYFYNDSKAEGLECYKDVRSQVDTLMSPDVVVLLKRGCTEFEIGGKGGPSDTWEVSEDQRKMELLLDDVIVQDVIKIPQPDHLKENVFRSWIHWAYAGGDLTYKEFTRGEPLFPQYVTYHQEVENVGRKEAG
jgi:hypothetical protein